MEFSQWTERAIWVAVGVAFGLFVSIEMSQIGAVDADRPVIIPAALAR